MFAVIYRGYVKKEFEPQFRMCWKVVADYFVRRRGAISSTLHKTEDGMWVAYSKWPDKATRDASWPQGDEINAELPSAVHEAICELKACLEEQLPEICMEITEEVS